MKLEAIVCVLGVGAVVSCFAAPSATKVPDEAYVWWNSGDTDFGTAGNWKSNSVVMTEAPDENTFVAFTSYGGNVAFAADHSVSNAWLTQASAKFDLGGHTWDIKERLYLCTVTAFDSPLFTFTNGAVKTGSNLQLNYGPADTTYYFGRARVCGPEASLQVGGGTFIQGQGAYLEITGGATFSADKVVEMHSKNAGASLRVTGEGTSATLNGGFQLGGAMSTFEISDGATMTISGIGLTAYGNRNGIGRSGSRNLFLIDNATVTYAPTTAVNLNIGDTDNSAIAGPNTLCVTNNGVLTIPTASNIRCGVSIGQNAVIHDSRIVVCDGGKIESQGGISLGVGQKKSCGGHLLSVDNGTVDILSLSTASVVHDSNSVIRVQGRTGRLIVRSTSTTALNLRASPIVQFVVPPTGFAEVPISVPNGAVANDLEGLYAPIRLEIDAQAFARAHPQTSVTLIEAGKDSTAALEELRDNATFVCPANKPWLGGELSVVDGKKLVLTTFAHPGMALIVR